MLFYLKYIVLELRHSHTPSFTEKQRLQRVDILHFLSLSCSYLQDVIKLKIRTLNVYLYVFGAKTLEIIFISDYQAHGLLLHMLSMNFWTQFQILCL